MRWGEVRVRWVGSLEEGEGSSGEGEEVRTRIVRRLEWEGEEVRVRKVRRLE